MGRFPSFVAKEEHAEARTPQHGWHVWSSTTAARSCPKTPRGDIPWSIVSGFKGLENDVVILAGLTDIDDDGYRGVAYVGMSRARTQLQPTAADIPSDSGCEPLTRPASKCSL